VGCVGVRGVSQRREGTNRLRPADEMLSFTWQNVLKSLAAYQHRLGKARSSRNFELFWKHAAEDLALLPFAMRH
jgi:hypothetical protein